MIYLSGPMTGVKDYNYPLFNRIAKKLRELGHEVINPVEICKHLDPLIHTWKDYMDICMDRIVDCKAIYLLNNWQDSKGARIEFKTAIELGFIIYNQGDLLPIETISNENQ